MPAARRSLSSGPQWVQTAGLAETGPYLQGWFKVVLGKHTD